MFKKPLFWDLSRKNILSYSLIPFTLPILLRNFLFKILKKEKTEKIKTICIGNIYLGGTGKTPLTIKIYEILKKLNYNIATVKKDYSKQKDEQLLLKKKTYLIVKKSRKLALQEGIKKKLDILVFDDGLQEISIDYNVKFVCFKLNNWIGNGNLIPAGPMREKISSLKRFDAIFLNGYSKNITKIKNQIQKINSQIHIFRTFYKISNIEKYNLNLRYLIFSGIGNPSDFREVLSINKFKIKKEIIFSDHYNYDYNDFKEIVDLAKNKNLQILTTEKDYMKVPKKYRNKINFISLDLIIEKENELINILKKLK